MKDCYVIVEKTEYLSKCTNYEPEVKILYVHGNRESAINHLKHIQKHRSHNVEWGEFGAWFSYELPNILVYGTGLLPRENAKITVSLKRVDYIAD